MQVICLKYFRQQAITAPQIPTQSKELLWYPVSRRRVKFALGVMRATAARGVPRFGSRNGLHGPRDAHHRRAHRRHDDYRGGGRQVQALAFHPDRPLVASGNEDGTITLIDADTATQTKVQRLFGCTQLAFSTAAAMHAAAMLAWRGTMGLRRRCRRRGDTR